MLVLGQPLHTYDYDKVEGNELTCRFAGEKENLKTLDGVERILHHTDLVIADKAGNPVCIAGVMGGLDSEITDKTKSVLLEAAVFDSASVRRTSRRLGLVPKLPVDMKKESIPQEQKWQLIGFASC